MALPYLPNDVGPTLAKLSGGKDSLRRLSKRVGVVRHHSPGIKLLPKVLQTALEASTSRSAEPLVSFS